MNWQIKISKQAAKTIVELDKISRDQILTFIENKIATCIDPRSFGSALTGELKRLWRYRVGKFRIVCRLDDENITIFVLAVGKRDRIYLRSPVTQH